LPSNHCETKPPGESTQSELNSTRYLPGASPPTEYRPSEPAKLDLGVPAPVIGVAVTQAPPSGDAGLPPVTRPVIRLATGSATLMPASGFDVPTLRCDRTTVARASPMHGPASRR
jgi:hypothetical protein